MEGRPPLVVTPGDGTENKQQTDTPREMGQAVGRDETGLQ